MNLKIRNPNQKVNLAEVELAEEKFHEEIKYLDKHENNRKF